jgi:hypothetical protein
MVNFKNQQLYPGVHEQKSGLAPELLWTIWRREKSLAPVAQIPCKQTDVEKFLTIQNFSLSVKH